MPTLTDPADELARACDLIIENGYGRTGENTIADAIGVNPWSKEFYQAVFCLIEQADRVREILESQGHSQNYRSRADAHLDGIKNALTPQALRLNSDHSGATRIELRQHVAPVAMLSPTIARTAQYPLLSPEEVNQLLEEIDTLLEWLVNHQIEEQDMLRSALIEGLKQYRFRLERVSWLGWEYSAESLRVTIGAYLAIERGQFSADTAPITEALLIKTGELFGKIWRATGVMTNATDRIGSALKLYGFVTAVNQGGGVVAALTQNLGS